MLPCSQCIALAACKSKPIVHCKIVFQEYSDNDWEVFDLDLLASFLSKSDWYISEYDQLSFYTPIDITELCDKELTKTGVHYKMQDGRIVYLDRKDGQLELRVIKKL